MAAIRLERLTFNMFGVNTYILWDEETRECAIVDPGMMSASENARLISLIQQRGLTPKCLINTHLHIDHVAGNKCVSETFGLPISACEDDAFLGDRISSQAEMFGLPIMVEDVKIAQSINDGEVLKIGEHDIKVRQVPGHSPGSVVLYCEDSKVLISGDALFSGSIGRTDLPGGDYATLINAIKNKILTLPEDVVVYPGHGPETSVGDEKRYNTFFR